METLAGYSSDDSSPEPDHVPCTSSSQSLNPELTSSLDNTQHEYSEEEEIAESPSLHILSYLQEYSMNAKRQTTLFAYLPWNPAREIKNKLRSAGELAIQSMRQNVSNFDQRFTSNTVVGGKSVAHGAFGITNKRSLTDLHVSLFPNINLPAHKIKQLTNNILRLVKKLKIPLELVHTAPVSTLDLLLSDGKAPANSQVRLKFDNKLHLYKLTKSGSLFVGIGLAKFVDWESKKTLPQFDYLNQVSLAIEDEAIDMGLPFHWLQFNTGQKGNRGEIWSVYYHFTLAVCELNPRGQRMNDAEYVRTKAMLEKVDVSKFLQGITYDVDHLVLRSPDKSTKIPLM